MQRVDFTGTTATRVPVSKNLVGEIWFQIVSGTNTIVVECSFDDGTTFSALGIRKAVDDTIAASAAVAGMYYCKVGGGIVQVRCSAFVGNASVYIGESNIALVG